MTSMKIVYFSRPPTPLSIYVQHFSTLLDHGRPFLNEPSLALPNKLWNNNRTEHVEKRNQSKNKTKSRHIQLTMRSIVRFSPQTMASVMNGFTV